VAVHPGSRASLSGARHRDPPATQRRQACRARGGIPARGIPACIACHGPTGHGNPFAAFPRISWQHAAYVTKSLQDYKSGERASDANQVMRNVASLLKDDEIRALASYVQGLD